MGVSLSLTNLATVYYGPYSLSMIIIDQKDNQFRRLIMARFHTVFAMCLDPSHATPYSHRWPAPERREVVGRFLGDLDRLGHVHWNDSDLFDVRGREDLHLPVGDGNLGERFHRTIKQWARQDGHIALLEHFYDRDALDRELAYIALL